MSRKVMSSYDEILYPTHSFSQAHPNRLATHAALFGMSPAPLEKCRVLELGCGDGGNIIPLACNFPESYVVGVDSASRPVAAGQAIVDDLGLDNIRLLHAGIEDIGSEFGKFDYVIAHGIYSWVPADVRDKIMAVCGELLTPQGVGYVSYNAMPGGHVRLMLREMMQWHARGAGDSSERVERSKALVGLLADALDPTEYYAPFIIPELERIRRLGASNLVHDDLGETNAHFYFHEFIAHAARHGLQFLAEADFTDMAGHSMKAEAVKALQELTDDPILAEQYADFIKCRKFRQTLLCRKDVVLARPPAPERVEALYVSAPLKPQSPRPDIRSREVERFEGGGDAKLSSDAPLVKATAFLLGERWPQAFAFGELFDEARTLAGLGGDEARVREERERLSGAMLEAYKAGVVMLGFRGPDLVTVAGERPSASRLARAQLRHGAVVTNQLHVNIEIKDALGQNLIQLLDGTRTRAELAEEIASRIRSGAIRLDEGGGELPPMEAILDSLPAGLEKSLKGLAASAMLVA
jgi:methyltransferase-like protein/trans-aconitate methyltransferase